MHGQPRKPLKPDDAASVAKAAKLRNLQSQLLHNHHNKIYTKEAIEISSKLLELNPEIYTGWNYRKLAVGHLLQGQTDPSDSRESIAKQELLLVENALKRNIKSYGAWHHRKWIMSKGLCSYDSEFKLLDRFQKIDSRNFHAWNYRRFVAALKNVSEKEELKYTTNMIETNFSNYSAWHNRSVILSNLLKQKAQGFTLREKVLAEEYDFVHQALFVDPRDQSGWFYHLWLLEQTVAPDSPVLVSTWPIHGLDLIIEKNMGGFLPSTKNTFRSATGSFPLILYFNQSVEGVSSTTVRVNFRFCKEDPVWMPLSSNNSKRARAWITYLKFPDTDDNYSEAYPVEVSIGHSQGIISSSGAYYRFSSRFAFTASLRCINSENAEDGASTKMLNWGDENFRAFEMPSLELSPFLSLDQLSINNNHDQMDSRWLAETLANEIAQFRELLLEDNCKIGKLTLARLLLAHDEIMTCSKPSEYQKVNTEEILELFSDLMKSDPTHSRYYKDKHSLVLMEQVISNRKSLAKHCLCYGDSNTSSTNIVCLRLNNFSLSKIGSFENLLWVQMLDLSHNELHSIQGLEALQNLSCLNLSHNRFCSFTALEPLRSLPSLTILDVSYNEIGAHSIDTMRYSCSSPLSHTTVRNDDSFADYMIGEDNWEAVLFFSGLRLTQLDVTGNAVSSGDSFRSLLLRVLPKLKWLDGEAVNLVDKLN